MAGDRGRRRTRLLFVVNSDWFFLSHRLPIALAAREAGIEVSVAAIDTGEGDRIRGHGFSFIPLPLKHRSMNPVVEAAALVFLLRLYRQLRPDIVHHVTIKPVLYGSLAARFLGGIRVVNAVSGLGFMFSSDTRARLLLPMVRLVYRLALRAPRSRTIFQNPDDLGLFLKADLLREKQAVLIRGSGVDLSVFRPVPEPMGAPVVLLPARMIWDKGVAQFVEAARTLREEFPHVRFVLAGKPDEGNPRAVPEGSLRDWATEGVIEWLGHRTDMPAVMASASIVTLPTTHREGVPKTLLEAAAAGRPIVTTDVPGCRETVRPGENGLLVPPGDVDALVEAFRVLLNSKDLRRQYGRAGREMAVRHFSQEVVVEQTMDVYRGLLESSV